MRTFKKGKLISVVEDKDVRIASYFNNGWEEVGTIKTVKPTLEDELLHKALSDANNTENTNSKITPQNKIKAKASNKKINETIKANVKAKKESSIVDDGLIPDEAAAILLDETEEELKLEANGEEITIDKTDAGTKIEENGGDE